MTSHSSSGPWSPTYGTTTLSTFERSQTPTRLSYTSRSDTASSSSSTNDASSARQMRRITVSPSPSASRLSDPMYNDNQEEGDSMDATEVEAALMNLDNEFDETEETLTQWSSRGASVTSASYTAPSYSSYTNSNTDAYTTTTTAANLDRSRILSTISERTENPSRPTSRTLSQSLSLSAVAAAGRPTNPTPDALLRRSGYGSASSPLSGSGSGGVGGRRAGELIAFFEDRTSATSPVSVGVHARVGSTAPGGPRPRSPYSSGTTPTGSGSGRGTSSMSSLLSPPTRGGMTTTSATFSDVGRVRSPLSTTDTGYLSPSTYTNTHTNTNTNTNTFTPSNTYTSYTPTSSTITSTTPTNLRRPQTQTQTSPRSPLTSVRNIVAAWKERTPIGRRSSPGGEGDVGLFRRK
ncbi:hypothetical protein PILCRDRAFT_17136, partial [Piloderma croceum F 1598]